MKTVWYGGVDPGEYGCFAFYAPPCDEFPTGYLHFIDLKIQRGLKAKALGFANVNGLAAAIKMFIEIQGPPKLVVIETPHSLPTDGHVGAFTFGKACGTIEGIMYGLDIPQLGTVPAVWKAQLGLSKIKSQSIKLAQEKFKDTEIPQGHAMFTTPQAHGDGRAEAALLAWMAAHKIGRVPV